MKIQRIGVLFVAAIAVVSMLAVTGCEQPETVQPIGHELDSDTFSQVVYDAASQELTVVFRQTGETYVYQEVPAGVYEGLIGAESAGTYFHENIRDQYEFERP